METKTKTFMHNSARRKWTKKGLNKEEILQWNVGTVVNRFFLQAKFVVVWIVVVRNKRLVQELEKKTITEKWKKNLKWERKVLNNHGDNQSNVNGGTG